MPATSSTTAHGAPLPAGPPVGRLTDARSAAVAAALAAAASAAFVWSAAGEPLLALVFAAAFLFVVVEEDLRRSRIPNWLTLPGFGLALALTAWSGGWSGAAAGLTGAATAFAVLFPAFAFGVMGAGDVKAAMVLGALWGPIELLASLWWMLLAGGVLGVALAAARGTLPDILRRWALSIWTSLASRRAVYFGPEASPGAAASVPFGVAIAVGAAAHQYWGLPWT